MKKNTIISGIILLLLANGCISPGKIQPVQEDLTQEPVILDLFVMSQCPWGVRTENILSELKKNFGENLAINLYYIVKILDAGDGKTEDKGEQKPVNGVKTPVFQSLHGPPEVEENMRQLLISKYYPDRWWDYLISRNSDIQSPEWESYALYNWIDPGEIESWIESGKGSELLVENVEEQEKGERWKIEGVEWEPPGSSPTIYINGKLYQGSISIPSLAVAVNKALGGEGFEISVIPECYSDRDCFKEGKIGRCIGAGTLSARCEFSESSPINLIKIAPGFFEVDDMDFISGVKRNFPGLKIREISSDSEEGAGLIQELELNFLPSYLFDRSIEKAKSFNFLIENKAIVEKNNYYPMIFSQVREGVYLDRERIPDRLNVFLRSQSPFIPVVVKKLFEAKKEGKLNPEVKIQVDYIGEIIPAPGGVTIKSTQGLPEVEEDMRQLCIQRYYPKNFGDYLINRNEDIESTLWERPAIEARIDPARIIACIYKEGRELLIENIQRAQEMNIRSSYAFLWENKYLFYDPKRLSKLPGFESVRIQMEDKLEIQKYPR